MGNGVIQLQDWYKKQGAKVTCSIYKGVRHEYLNDTSAELARREMADFVISVVND